MNWNHIVIIICILLAAFALWKEWARIKRSRRVLRLAAVALAAAAMACITLPLTYYCDGNAQSVNEAILITPGFNKDSMGKYSGARLFTMNRQIKKKFPKAILINDAEEMRADLTITQLRILGDGLNKEQLKQLKHLPVIFRPAKAKTGISAISWNAYLKTGERLQLQGEFKNTSAQKVKLVLMGLSTNLDSAIVEPNSATAFNLNTVPKSGGNAVYVLLAISGKDTIAKESIPVQINPVKPLKIVMLMASPDFESRFLKNWLSENGYAVAGRAAISKGKFNTEFINIDKVSLDKINKPLLHKFDLLIGDLSVLKSLSAAENFALKQEVEQEGMGLIIRADSTNTSASWLQNSFPVDRITGKDTLPASLMIQGQTNPTAKLSREAVHIVPRENTQPLVRDVQGHILASSKLAGAGKLVFTPLNNTFGWMLAGNKIDYSAVWTLLINKAARKTSIAENWLITTPVPIASASVGLQLESSSMPASIVADNTFLSPGQNPFIPFKWDVNYYPKASGWQMIRRQNGSLASVYIYGDEEWTSIRSLKKQTDTRRYAAENAIVKSVTKQIHQKTMISVPKIYFYILLLLACSFLWAEAKMT